MMNDVRSLMAYKKAFKLAMDIFEISKGFPKEEKYALTDQIRRSSRSVCSNMAEGYRKRRYIKHFISKMTDSDGENAETQVWLAFAYTCQYIEVKTYQKLIAQSNEVGKLIGHMINHPEKYGVKIH